MDPQQLRALRELRDRGSIAQVAVAFRVTPSAVSQQLAALQRRAGVALTRIDGRRTVLTDAGHALADAAVGVEIAMAQAQDAVDRFHATEAATVSVSALSSVAQTFFPALLSARLPSDPVLSFTDRDVAHHRYAALTADIDLVIAHRLPGADRWPSGIQVIPLLDEPLDLTFRRGHDLDRAAPASIDELADVEWINVHEDYPLAGSVSLLGALSGREPRVRHQVNDYAVTAALLGASDAVALLPRHTGRCYLGAGLVQRPIAHDAAPRRSIDVLARPEALRRRGVRAVLDAIRAHAALIAGADEAESTPRA
ncbi:LysR family transcriptional regulator [uncultured Microbacterium sp.]|uniref:LysR family transcriptional regulator n=1 Tax=uncultured Microbacterium sp. TaxID=191216 RepID=UPI0025F56E66|nr:LysR family transcriptional regulator [uncultured Microbacterium sp.]